MKTTILAAACLTLCAGSAMAQSSVTLFGVIDTDIRYATHVNRNGDSQTQLGTGGLSESRWGMRGSEDLGGGNAVIFELENRFYANSGAPDASLPFWNTALVGFRSSTLGRFTLGRQTNTVVDSVSQAYGSNPWVPYAFAFQPEITMMGGIWVSNLAKYAVRTGPFFGELSYAFGNQAGHTANGSQQAIGLGFLPAGPVKLAAAYSQSRDDTSGALIKIWTAGGSYTWNATRFHVGYFRNRTDAGFTQFLNGPYTVQALTALKFLDFSSRQMFTAGITQSIDTSWHLSFNVWRTLQTGKTEAQNGNATQFQAVADYSLSRRTNLYVETDYGLYRQDLIGAQLQGINGVGAAQKSTQFAVMAGMRHAF